ncbi:restriction endonuclease subunit S [Lachnospiraceae bacterium CLA-AA-H246]|uniref:Restriction endonuclease subunit S n=1 Tax=Hominisplanchenecus faecis TaxID=2885351 RepID=A0ABS8EV48_9FIRM|nr:restriction endonuclease subunit S [Hominisplanchenecus faecis]MCC2149071.1 restriction endonuclease subunit S [Hominisplanchenecus faecis]
MKVRLGDYIQEYSVKNKDDENISVYSVTNTKGFCKDYFGKEVASKDKTTYKIVPYGYFAYNPSRINVGSVDWQRKEKKVIVSPLYNVFSVSPNLERQYLYYYLKSDFVLQRIKAVATGSVRDNLKLSMLYEFPIELPKLENQRKIVKILDKVSDVVEKKEQELEQLDTFVKSRFVELFGDPIKNPKGWEVVKLSECLERIDNGKSFTCDSNAREGVFPAILKLSAATYGDYRPYENKALLDEKQFVESVEVHRGDLLFTRKNTPDLVGMAAYVFETPEKLMMPDLIFRLVTNERMTPTFLWQLINNREFRPAIQGISGGSAKSMSNISKERLKNIEVICPPISEQKKLEGVLEQVDKLKSKIQKSLEETQLLFDSLMQKYFG